jgi:LemA protein
MPGTLLAVLIVVVVLVVGVLLYVVGVYNRLVTLRERFRNAFSQIDVQLKRRHDLIPNLVEAAKGYMAHEKETLERVIQARNAAVTATAAASAAPGDAAAVRGAVGAENMLVAALGQFRILSEAYPDLKASTNISQLMEELTSTENKIAFARQHFNDSVTTYNSYRQSVPPALIAGPLGFQSAELFEVDDPKEREVVQVDLSRDPKAPAGTA